MRFDIICAATIILVFLSSFADADMFTVASQYSFVKDDPPECFENGQLKFTLAHSKASADLHEDLKGIGLKAEGSNSYIDVRGSWYDKNYNVISHSGRDQKAIFISEEYSVKDRGDYYINISGVPVYVMEYYPELETRSIKVSCPGYLHSCKMLNLKVNKCFTRGDYFYIYLSGLGKDKFSKVDIERDLMIDLNYKVLSKGEYSENMPASNTVITLGDDQYLIKTNLKDLKNKVRSVRLKIKGCIDEIYNTTSVKECEFFDVSEKTDEDLPKRVQDELRKDGFEYKERVESEKLISETVRKREETEKKLYIRLLRFIYSLTSFISS